jgi:ribA/ribD-fused uncharacterized protein
MMDTIRDRDALIQAIHNGLKPAYIFFWGHKPLPSGEIGKSCFSQWWSATFELDGVTYPTAEHFMMAAKARLFGDTAIHTQILAADSPNSAKALGRKVQKFNNQVWEQQRFQLVVQGNLAKFSQNPELQNFLLSTGNQILVEASPVDPIWGIGLAADHRQAGDPKQWPGLNLLGFALMEVRHKLQTRQGI